MINRVILSITFVILASLAQASTDPTLITRKEQPYVAIKTTVTIQELPAIVPKDLTQLYAWLEAHKLKPAGAPFVRYVVVDMDKGLDIEIGVPVVKAVSGDSKVTSGVLPTGKYASLTYFGDYSGLKTPNAQIQKWGMDKGLTWKRQKTEHGEEWVGRLEVYKTDPNKEPDPSKWETEVLYLVDDAKKT